MTNESVCHLGMNTDAERFLFGIHRQGQEKVTYFLLAAAGASVAFALTQTKTAVLSYPHGLVGVALAAWAMSLLSGLKHVWQSDTVLLGNIELLRIQSGRHKDIGSNPVDVEWGSNTLREVLETASERGQRHSRAQFRWLVIGAGFYIAWHVYEMYLRSLPA